MFDCFRRLSLLAGCLGLCIPSMLAAQPGSKDKDAKGKRPIILSQRRVWRLEVGRVEPQILLNVERQWKFQKSFPPALLAAIRKHPKKKAIKPEATTKKITGENGYIRWTPDKKSPFQAGALLWYINGKKRKELVVGIDAVLGPKAMKKETAASLSFDELKVAADLQNGKLTDMRFAGVKLPQKSDASEDMKVSDTMETNVTGALSRSSSRAVYAANELLSDEVHQKFRAAAFANFKNESHHGITLGWLGYEHLNHNLMLLPGNPKETVAFRYRVSGKPFPANLVRRQIGKSGWPMVLSGHAYVGATDAGRRIFRPVEFQLSLPAKTTKPGKK